MQQEVLDYLETERVGVLAVEMLNGSPHGATVHFAHSISPLVFFFETRKGYRKAEALFGRPVTRASFVVGVDDNTKKTLQLDGTVEILKAEEKKTFGAVYWSKFPEKKQNVSGEDVVFFKFTPTVWKFTTWTSAGGKVIITSDEK